MGKRPSARSFACSPGPSCSSPGRPKPGPPPRRPFVTSTADPIDDGRNEINTPRENNDDYFGHVSTEDFIAQDAGYDADVEVVRPFAIEEPDDETDQTPTSAPTPNLPEATENWQKELVNSLRGLYCDSDSNDTHPLIRRKRGRKRKPDPSMAFSQSSQNIQSQPSKDWDFDTRVGSTVLSPKRRRKQSTHTKEEIEVSHSSLLASNDASTGSSPAVLSTSPHRSDKPHMPSCDVPAIDRMDTS
ncbi:hypothetical protein UA08_07992 [Talaromyces atroroseus]|uniref:Uncharacterized protein n=1 Tax=Talaromyces atroroseus TaxID=1441469 RepID=A0A225AM91_TALAT|nr:hypothetical protein UA08_07992 [Talaromyces atroroseus]OKL56689.1 hypothetical protein UA08_07992 [Talaromyces atroroseus]